MNKIIALITLSLMSSPLIADGTTAFSCKYPKYSDEEGIHKDENFALKFSIVEDKDGKIKAYGIGNQGVSEIRIIIGPGFTFLEITDVGNVATTTIDEHGASVHSRNMIIFGKLVATQYYGTCSIN